MVHQKVVLGPISLYGVSAEPSYGHAPDGAELTLNWYCGYIEDVYGYLPTKEQYDQGGYEVDRFCSAFGVQSLKPSGPDHLTLTMQRLGFK